MLHFVHKMPLLYSPFFFNSLSLPSQFIFSYSWFFFKHRYDEAEKYFKQLLSAILIRAGLKEWAEPSKLADCPNFSHLSDCWEPLLNNLAFICRKLGLVLRDFPNFLFHARKFANLNAEWLRNSLQFRFMVDF